MTHLLPFKRYRLVLALFLAIGLSLNLLSPLHAHAANSQYFPETGKTISGKFYQFWQANGGLPVFGYPITDQQNEVDPETSKTFLTQWFERNRFELHPENAGTKYEVLLGLLGKDLRRDSLLADDDFAKTTEKPGFTYFKETGHNLDGRFLDYWRENGGLERFGYPIDEGHDEVDPESGKVYFMQWFERARFELHPENKAPYNVLLGLLGNQIKQPKSKVDFLWKRQHFFQGLPAIAAGRDYFYIAGVEKTDGGVVQKYNIRNGDLLQRIGNSGTPQERLTTPRAVAVDNQGNVYASDWATAEVFKYDATGKFLLKWGGKGSADGQFNNLEAALAVDRNGNVYVGDEDNHHIQKFDSSGKFLTKWGSEGRSNGQFQLIGGITVDPNNNVYVTDAENVSIQKFDSSGKFLLKWGGDALPGGSESKFGLVDPVSISSDSQGNIYVVDVLNTRVVKISPEGQLLLSWGNGGGKAADGAFEFMGATAVNPDGYVFVNDAAARRIQKFRVRA